MSNFQLHASRGGYARFSSYGEGETPGESLGTETETHALGRTAVGRLFEGTGRRLAFTGALAAITVAAMAVGLTLPSDRVAAAPMSSRSRVALKAVAEDGRPYPSCFTVRVTGPGGAEETIFADLPTTHPNLFVGTNLLDTNRGDYPAEDIGGSGVFNPSSFTVARSRSGKLQSVTVTVPDAGADECPTPPDSSSPQHASTGNISVTNNSNWTVTSGNMSTQRQ